jgi:hypothetical protein
MGLWRWGRGVWYALLVVGAVDGLPGPNLDGITAAGLSATDWLTVLLIVSLAGDLARDGFARLRGSEIARWVAVWSAAFIFLWAVTVARSWVISDIPLKHAIHFGRAFIYVGVLIPLFAGALADKRVRTRFLTAAALAAALIAVTESVATVHPGALSLFVHVNQSLAQDGIIRLYTDALALVVAAFTIGLGAALLASDRRVRFAGAGVAVVCMVDIALSLTRALYLGVVVGVVLAVAIWLIRPSPESRLARRQLARILALLAIGVALVVAIHPPSISNSAVNGVASRAVSLFTAVSTGNTAQSTIAIRQQEASVLEHILGSQWPFGLGFLDNRNRYFVGLPAWDAGSILDSDVGVLNVVMTMGVLGAVVEYFPFVGVAFVLARRRLFYGEAFSQAWLAFGVFAWLLLALASSVTLTLLFNPTSVVVSAAVVGLGVSVVDRQHRSGPDGRLARGRRSSDAYLARL